MSDPYPVVEISAAALCQMFNEGQYWERVQVGELREEIRRNGHPTSPKADMPFCTHSQLIKYVDQNGDWMAIVHQYLKPDGTLGTSGKPDPKKLLVNGIIYQLILSETNVIRNP